MLPDEIKENMIVGIIMDSKVSADTKNELIKYVRSHNGGAVKAAFRLGQMDMRMSAVDALRADAVCMKGICKSCVLAAAELVDHLGR